MPRARVRARALLDRVARSARPAKRALAHAVHAQPVARALLWARVRRLLSAAVRPAPAFKAIAPPRGRACGTQSHLVSKHIILGNHDVTSAIIPSSAITTSSAITPRQQAHHPRQSRRHQQAHRRILTRPPVRSASAHLPGSPPSAPPLRGRVRAHAHQSNGTCRGRSSWQGSRRAPRRPRRMLRP